MTGAVIGSLRAELSANIAKFQSDMGQAADVLKKFGREAKKIGREIEEVGKSMSIAFTLPLVALGAESVKRSTQAAQAMAKLQAAIASTGNASGKTAEQLNESAKALRNISTFQDDDILGGITANLLRFGNVQGATFDRAQKAIVNLSAALGGDLQSNTIKVGRALQDPIKGVNALTRMGVLFTAQQKEQIKALVQSGHGMEAQQIILQALEKAYGGSAKALRDATPGAELKNVWDDFTETIGDQLVPVLKDLASILGTAMKWFNSLPAPIQKMAIALAAIAAAIGPLLTGFGFFIKMGGQIAGLLGTLFTWIASLSAVTLGWVAALAAVGLALVIFWKSIKDVLHGDFKKAWTDAKDSVKNIAAEIKSIWNSATTLQTPPGGAAGTGPAGKIPRANFNREDTEDLKKQQAAIYDFDIALQKMATRIKINLAGLVIPKASQDALALNAQLDEFIEKAEHAGVNTEQFAGKIEELRTRIEHLRASGLQKEAIAFSENVDAAAVSVDKLAHGSIPPLQDKLHSIDDTFKQLSEKIKNDIEQYGQLAESNDDAAKAMERLQKILAGLGVAHDKATAAAIAQSKAEQDLANLTSQRNEFQTRTQIEDLRQARGAGGPIGGAQAELQATTRDLVNQQLESQSKLRELEIDRSRLVEQNLNHENDTQIKNLDSEIALQQELADLVKDTTASQLVAARRIDQAFSEFADSLSEQLSDMLMNWDGSLKGLMGVFRNLAANLFIKPGTDAISGVFSGALKSLAGSLGGGGGDLASNVTASIAANPNLFADGGSLNPGEWGIAGEKGPEPIFGGTGGLSVMSNPDARKAFGQRTVNQTWIINTPDANSFRPTMRQTARQAKMGLARA